MGMVYTRFVEAGRVCLVSNGMHNGSLVVICDVIDVRRVLVDNPVQNIPRQAMRLQDLKKAFAKTAWSKKLEAKKRRAQLNDFDRFKVKIVKQQKARLIKKAKASLKK